MASATLHCYGLTYLQDHSSYLATAVMKYYLRRLPSRARSEVRYLFLSTFTLLTSSRVSVYHRSAWTCTNLSLRVPRAPSNSKAQMFIFQMPRVKNMSKTRRGVFHGTLVYINTPSHNLLQSLALPKLTRIKSSRTCLVSCVSQICFKVSESVVCGACMTVYHASFTNYWLANSEHIWESMDWVRRLAFSIKLHISCS